MKREVFFALLAATMLAGTLLRMKKYRFTPRRAVILAFLLLFGGVGGTYILGYLEVGSWGNISYYGSVFFVPVLMLPFSMIIKYSYTLLMDYCAPCGIAAIAVGKFHCFLNGCCGGRVLWQNSMGEDVVFPSQLTEMAVAAVILAVLLLLERKGRHVGKLYPLFLIMYGSTRFVLNYFRDAELVFGVIPTAGILSLAAVIIGVVWLLILKKRPAAAESAAKGESKKQK
ncbi:MAG: prolipoprotein diacylglyceryl transferase [Clostridia bacterium]|nr:prolipoprotein diacylglyceryl transferase [Clostridia bacterium]